MVGGRLEHDLIRLGAHRVRDRVAVLGQLADLLVAGHHALHRPAQVDRRRPGVDQGRGRPPDRRLACVRSAVPLVLGTHRQADRRHLADGRGPADDHLADRPRHLAGRPARDLDESVGQPPLVDQVQDAAILAERRAKARWPDRDRDPLLLGQTRCAALRVQDDAGRVGRRLLQGLGGPGHRHRGLDHLAGEGPEEPPPAHVGLRRGHRHRRVSRG